MEARLEDVFRSLSGRLHSAYPVLVTASACALLVLLLWPAAQRNYVAEAIAVASTRPEAPAPLDDASAWLRSDEVLRAVVAKLRVSQPDALDAMEDGPTASDPIAAVRSRLQLTSLSGPDERSRLAIACDARSRRAAVAVADELGRQLSEHYAGERQRARLAAFQERERVASQELNEARGAQQRLEIQLEGLRHAQLTTAVTANAATRAPAATAAASEGATTQLRRTLDAMKVERDRLLEIYLPAHPQVQALSAQISRLEESLRRGSPHPGLEDSSAHAARSGRGQVLLEWRRDESSPMALASGQAAMDAQERSNELVQAIRKTQLDLLAATQRRQEAEQNWQSLEEERSRGVLQTDVTWTVEPARIAGTRGGIQAQAQLAAALLAAALGAVAATWLVRLAARDRPLASVAELRSSLALPVLGSLSGGDHELDAPSPPNRSQAPLNFVTRCSEVVLATFAVTLLAAASLDRGLLADLACDPVATLGELVQRLV